MVVSTNLASAQPGSNLYARRLRRKRGFPSLSAPNICPHDPVPFVTGELNTPIDTMRQSNRKTVIINDVLYPPDLFSNIGASSTVTNLEAIKLGRGIPLPLPSDYLRVEEASREATLQRMSKLSASRSTAKHTQSGEASATVQKQGPLARSAQTCPALSSHPVPVPEAVMTMPEPSVCTGDTGHPLLAVQQADTPRQEGVERAQKCRVRFELNLESTGEKCERLERERDDAFKTCDALERILDSVYRKCNSLQQELESTNGRRVYLEKNTVNLRRQVQNLETEAAAQFMKLDNEIGRGRLRDAEIRQLREENQRLQAEISEQSQSHDRSRTEVDQGSGASVVAAIAQSLHADRQLRVLPKGSLADIVLADDLLQKEDLGLTLYDNTDAFGATHFGFQNKAETSHQRFQDPQITSRSAADVLIDYSSPNIPPISVVPQDELNNPETVLARHQSMLQDDIHADELGATASNETLRQQTNSIDIDPVTDQLPEFLLTPSLSSLPQYNDALSFELSKSTQDTQKGAGLGTPCLIPSLAPRQLPELDSDTSSEDNGTECDQPNTFTHFRVWSPTVRGAPKIHRVHILSKETEQKDDETRLTSHLNTWEWASVPDLQLWDPK